MRPRITRRPFKHSKGKSSAFSFSRRSLFFQFTVACPSSFTFISFSVSVRARVKKKPEHLQRNWFSVEKLMDHSARLTGEEDCLCRTTKCVHARPRKQPRARGWGERTRRVFMLKQREFFMSCRLLFIGNYTFKMQRCNLDCSVPNDELWSRGKSSAGALCCPPFSQHAQTACRLLEKIVLAFINRRLHVAGKSGECCVCTWASGYI